MGQHTDTPAILIPCGANVHAGMTWTEARDAAKAANCRNPYACAEWTMGDADWEHPGTPAPVEDSPGDVHTRTIPLDGGTAIVEHVGDRVEVTIRLGARIVCALALSRAEASALGMAVARPGGAVLDDLFAVADAMNLDASTMLTGQVRR